LPSRPWQIPEALLEFLAAGPPPIYVGFGAVASFIRQHGLREIATAVAGRRALFFPGWSQIASGVLPSNFFVLGDTPHAWLFARTSMVIHHGGAGTSHTATGAGVPSVVLPVGADQFFWASRLASVGVAPQYIRGTRLDARILARMIEFAELDAVRARAVSLAAAMAPENGVANAVTAVEQFVAATGAALLPAAAGCIG
jgi:UDP:flavonoid glycosyltransferase YjiC (YdhE family)